MRDGGTPGEDGGPDARHGGLRGAGVFVGSVGKGVAVVALTGVGLLWVAGTLLSEPDAAFHSVTAEVTLADPDRDVSGLPDGTYLLTLVSNEQATVDTPVEPELHVAGSDGAGEQVSVVIDELHDDAAGEADGVDGRSGPLLVFGDQPTQMRVREALDRCVPDGACVRQFQMSVAGLADLDGEQVVVVAEQTFVPGRDSVPEGAGLLLTVDGGPDGGRHGRSSSGIGPAYVVVDDGQDPAGTRVEREWTMSLPRGEVPEGEVDAGRLAAVWRGAAIVGLVPEPSRATVTVAVGDDPPVPVVEDGERAADVRGTRAYERGHTSWQLPLTLDMACDADVCEATLTLTVATVDGSWVAASWSNMIPGVRTVDGQRLSGWSLQPTGP